MFRGNSADGMRGPNPLPHAGWPGRPDTAGLAHRKMLEQIDADLTALEDILPGLYDLAVPLILGRTQARIHTATRKAVELAFEALEAESLTRRRVVSR